MNSKLILMCTALIMLAWVVPSNAQEVDKTLSPYFFIESDDPGLDQLPLKSTSADVSISGVVAAVTVSQVYANEGTRPIEAVYTFPASSRAAMNGMKMIIGTRIVEAEIKEKNKARQVYEQAKSEGKRTSLLEQQRPNVFQMNVANIMPGDVVEVVLEYTELLIPTDGVYEFIYPTVVGPRYSNENTATASTNNQFVSSPYTRSGVAPSYSFDLDVRLAAAIPLQQVECPSHKIDVAYLDIQKANITLNPIERVGGNRDFILQYKLAGGQIESGLMLYEGKDENFFTLMIQPPDRVTADQIPPREYIFVVDVSGSMRGFPLDVSKTLLRNLIANLRPTDRFNIILFAGTSYKLSNESLLCNTQNINYALNMISQQNGGGGTELLPALRDAMRLPRCENGLSRSIVVVTDGYISVEKQTFDLISGNLDNANVFAFGIGSSVNRHLIEGMAHVGHGEPFIITSRATADEQADKFREYIERPVLTNIKSHFGDFEVYDVEPSTIPDVLAQRPIVIYGKWKGKPKGTITVKGASGNKRYVRKFNVEEVVPDPQNEGLKYIWAREKIRLLGDYKYVDRYSNLEASITNLGLKYNLMTDYTSFVAVDKVIVNGEVQLAKVDQPLPLPQGVSDAAVGFDMEIAGIVRRTKEPSEEKVQIELDTEEVEEGQNEAEIIEIKRIVTDMLNNAFAKDYKSLYVDPFDIHIEVNEHGVIEVVKLLNADDPILEKMLEYMLIGWQFEELNPTQTLHLTIPISLR